jgi:hypothetical protein
MAESNFYTEPTFRTSFPKEYSPELLGYVYSQEVMIFQEFCFEIQRKKLSLAELIFREIPTAIFC